MRAAIITRYGDAETLEVQEVDPPSPGVGQVIVELEAGGVNFHDVLTRRGLYPGAPEPPVRIGIEGAGTVVEAGEGVVDVNVGDRVVWAGVESSHAELVAVPAESAVPIPADIEVEQAAAVLAQGLTAHYLATSVHPIKSGESALIWAAAGGVGQLLTQVVKLRGGRVLAAVSSPDKKDQASAAGADDVVVYDEVPGAVRSFTDGRGVDAVFDSIGGPSFDVSVQSVRPRGTVAVYGAAGGPVAPLDILTLAGAGSVALVRPRLVDFIAGAEELERRAEDVFSWLRSGELTITIADTYRLDAIADAHRALESRTITGKLLLKP